jgi:hypothetical protein
MSAWLISTNDAHICRFTFSSNICRDLSDEYAGLALELFFPGLLNPPRSLAASASLAVFGFVAAKFFLCAALFAPGTVGCFFPLAAEFFTDAMIFVLWMKKCSMTTDRL